LGIRDVLSPSISEDFKQKTIEDLSVEVNLQPRTQKQLETIQSAPGTLSFRCNVCGGASMAKLAELERDKSSCSHCGSTVRARSIVHVLSIELFGQSLALPDFPVRGDLRGLGMSDWDGYAIPLAAKLDYQNTYYHREPRLDITHIDAELEGQFDFIISTDVFEHVPPP